MAVYLVAGAILAYVVLRSGQRADGTWKFAPLRATGMLAGGVFRIVVFVAVFAFALTLTLGALFSSGRSTFMP
ncbi:hypothetical protein [Rhodococcoides fascians]|uniref:hypothetical protein n=1 Tax=Rhodococcoides fascians TaxID=1828 RepID=UPI002781D6AA|nr:hypothetical protein [Rhodococcus fascians]MDQ0284752.1 choline-glycine betaine transporter [Rhodococcus fascians]